MLNAVRTLQFQPAWITPSRMGFMGDEQTAMIKTDPLVNMGAWRAARAKSGRNVLVTNRVKPLDVCWVSQ